MPLLLKKVSKVYYYIKMAKINHNSIELRRIVEYKHFFVGEAPIEIDAVLKQYDKSTLIRMAIILSCHYGNLSIPDNQQTLFSDVSRKHIGKLNLLFKNFYKNSGILEGTIVVISTFRTALELWRHIYAIRQEEYTNTIPIDDTEYNLFKVLLTINEQIVDFTYADKSYTLDELLFLNQFLTNETNNFDMQRVLQPQLYYVYNLAKLCEQNVVLRKASEVLFERWGITSWKQYVATLMYIANQTEIYRKEHLNGVPIINLPKLKASDETGLFSDTLVDVLSINENAYIPFEEPGVKEADLNIDYRAFRSKPFVRFKNKGEYAVINIQLLCERVFNSLYFDLIPLINGRKGSVGYFDFNKEFIEKYLFRKTLFNCIASQCYTFPPRNNAPEKETDNEPDFYCRMKSNLIVFECKAIKMNGTIRDNGDYHRLLDELHEKIVLKTMNLDPQRKQFKGEPEPIGIGQLLHHIEAIDQDEFSWDTNIPDEVTYYPIMVFEDVRILQPGLLSIINKWFAEELSKKSQLSHVACGCRPVMAVSINTLFLYDNLLCSRGITNVIDEFVHKHSTTDKNGNVILFEDADFDNYLRINPFHKANVIEKWLTKK